MSRPNIILILSDDHATSAIGCYGGPVPTPGCDRLATQGARFTSAWCTNALCAPSRASILTGTYGHVNGVRTLSTHFQADQPTFPALLQQAGYATALFGKWHLGHGGPHDPVGFDEWQVLRDQGDYVDPVLLGPHGQQRHTGYTTDVLTDLALGWLAGRDPDRPFCLLLHHKAPHRPWTPAPRHEELYADVDLPVPDTFFDDYSGRAQNAAQARMRVARDLHPRDLKQDPPEGLDGRDLALWRLRRYQEDYLGTAAALDESIAAVLDALEAAGLAEDTAVLYTSDQGFFVGEHGWFDKRFIYQESARMPLLLRYPPLVPPGTVQPAMVTNVDLCQTLLDLAGVPEHPRMQGRSLRPLLQGGQPPDWPTSVYYRYWEHDDAAHGVWAHYGVRTPRFTLVLHYADGLGLPGTGPRRMAPQWELFDLHRDPGELTSVHDDPAYRAVRDELEQELARLQAELGDRPYQEVAR